MVGGGRGGRSHCEIPALHNFAQPFGLEEWEKSERVPFASMMRTRHIFTIYKGEMVQFKISYLCRGEGVSMMSVKGTSKHEALFSLHSLTATNQHHSTKYRGGIVTWMQQHCLVMQSIFSKLQNGQVYKICESECHWLLSQDHSLHGQHDDHYSAKSHSPDSDAKEYGDLPGTSKSTSDLAE